MSNSNAGGKMVDDPIFANHLLFLERHRGHIVRRDDSWLSFAGDIESLSFGSPTGGQTDELSLTEPNIWLYPWSGEGWAARLSQAGYVPAYALSYMHLVSEPCATARVVIGRVDNDNAALQFAEVQARGFLDSETPDATWWARRFQRAAMDNYAREEQRYYTAFWDDRPAGVLLAVDSGETTGVYAVTTDPDYRGRGVSTALLAACAADAQHELVLQTVVGSYAHGFYERLGFREKYQMNTWTREREAPTNLDN